MDNEATWMSGQDADESMAKERYEYFTRPEPRENMSDIYTIDDPYLGPKTRVREVRVGMLRNSSEENKKTVLAYLEPYPHIRVDNIKPLQGWYKAKDEPANVRPRPCFTEAVLTEPYGGYCLPKGALVETPSGTRTIESLVPGDMVIGQRGGVLTTAEVLATVNRWCEGGLVKISVNGDQLLVTGEHPIYSLSRNDYVRADEVYLGEKIETRTVQEVREACRNRQIRQHASVLCGAQVRHKEDGLTCTRSWGSSYGNMDLLETGLQERNNIQYGNALRDLWGKGASSPWECSQRQTFINQRYSKIGRSESKDSCIFDWAQAYSRNESKVCGVGEVGNYRPQTICKEQVCLSEGQDLQSAIVVGKVGGGVLGCQGLELGIRTKVYKTKERGPLPTGLQTKQRNLYRSERLHGQKGHVQNKEGKIVGHQNNDIRPTSAKAVGSVVVGVEFIKIPQRVYDIQTTTENFYVRGSSSNLSFHTHNCAVGCQFCYINSGNRGYRGTGLISVPIDYHLKVRKQLESMRRGAAGYFSSFTDPFTPLENYYHNTQQAAEEFVNVGLPIFFLSRLPYPKWAIDLLTKNPHSYAQKSINTCNVDDWRHLSPGAQPLRQHINEIRKLKKRGIYVSIQCNPIVPGITNHMDVLKLFKQLRDVGTDHVIVKFVEANYSWAPGLIERLIKVFGKRGEEFAKLFTENQGGERCVQEAYRLEAHKIYSNYAKSIGLTYATCYEYKYKRDEAGNILSKTGVSIGREFTTADQCHGHKVPVYARNSADEQFKPLDVCPPSGCLYCADENKGVPHCGDELAGSAAALKVADFKIPIGMGKSKLMSLPLVH